ncbi:MAG: fumarylacetoacetase [Planctomycetota bacterium]
MHTLDDTHNPSLKSWVESANDPSTDFPIQNLPLAAFMASHGDDDDLHAHAHEHLGMPIGDRIVDISTLAASGILELDDETIDLLHMPTWAYFGVTGDFMTELRKRVQDYLRADRPAGGQQQRRLRDKCVIPIKDVELVSPVAVGNYTDFYASIHHAATVGAMFRPDNALLPNYKHVPIGYHGRASSIVVSGTDIRRPKGQQSPPDDAPQSGPTFGPCKLLDYELEVGCVIAQGNVQGEPIPLAIAQDHMLGLILVNDWSARDIQKWEYQPLGPFLAKNFATTTSPFVVTLDALAPFRCPGPSRPDGDPKPLPYLTDAGDAQHGGFDIALEVLLQSAEMLKRGLSPIRLSKGSFRDMYWSMAQLIAHHTSNGCNLEPGDLLASGTISGQAPDARGCLLELTWNGTDPASGKPRPRKPIELPTDEKRTFLADGDTVIFRASCEREGCRRIGFGECRGTITPALA